MTSNAETVEQYLQELPEERKEPMRNIRKVILEYCDPKLVEQMSYGMIGYVVPHSVYPPGYHVNPKLPLPYINLASQKNYISLYDMALYVKGVEDWWEKAYQNEVGKKANMGKCCIRFKKMDEIPYDLIAQLCQKVSVEDWIAFYEKSITKK